MGWCGIFRLGLVQAALGAVVVLVTSTLNRVMNVEYMLPAVVPGGLVALHYAVQMIRPRLGHGSDIGGRRTPWILGGMGVLVVGSLVCAFATTWMGDHRVAGLAAAVVGYALVGLGVGAAGTSLLVLLAQRVDARRRAAAATIMWILMIFGFAVTSGVVGHFLDPFSAHRLIRVIAAAAGAAFLVAFAAVWKIEGAAPAPSQVRTMAERATMAQRASMSDRGQSSFAAAMRQVWREPEARAFTVFVFLSMLAYSAQELMLEPFAGVVFGYSPGESTQLSGLGHGGAFLGMVTVGLACSLSRGRLGSIRTWTVGGCLASAAALLGLAAADLLAPAWPLRSSVVALGVANGAFTIAAIGSMMELSQRGAPGRAGVRMGLWGAAQAVAFALGGLVSTAIVDLVRYWLGSPTLAFAIVFFVEAAMFGMAAVCAAQIDSFKNRGTAATTVVSL